MIEIVTIVACIVLFALTLFQLALICGAPLGNYAWGGSHRILPANLRVGSVISILLYILFAVVILSKAEMLTVINNKTVTDVGIWVLAVYFYIGIVMNGISRSKRERNLMAPIALLLAIATTIIALG